MDDKVPPAANIMPSHAPLQAAPANRACGRTRPRRPNGGGTSSGHGRQGGQVGSSGGLGGCQVCATVPCGDARLWAACCVHVDARWTLRARPWTSVDAPFSADFPLLESPWMPCPYVARHTLIREWARVSLHQ